MRVKNCVLLWMSIFLTDTVNGLRTNSSCDARVARRAETADESERRRALQNQCGKAAEEYNRRIVGGVPVAPHRYPWLVSLMQGSRLHCGGAIITDHHVLSAGHCITFGVHFRDLVVDVGMHDRLSNNFLQLTIVKGVKHPDFTSNAVRDINDIAILTLSQRLTFGVNIRPICLPEPGMDFTGYPLTVAGWGKTRQHSATSSRYLLETQVMLVDSQHCKKAQVYRSNLEESSMLCAYTTGKDACQGDSGGPLFARNSKTDNKIWYQVGIVSWGIDCAAPNYPGVYTDVSKYINWIHSMTADGMYCV